MPAGVVNRGPKPFSLTLRGKPLFQIPGTGDDGAPMSWSFLEALSWSDFRLQYLSLLAAGKMGRRPRISVAWSLAWRRWRLRAEFGCGWVLVVGFIRRVQGSAVPHFVSLKSELLRRGLHGDDDTRWLVGSGACSAQAQCFSPAMLDDKVGADWLLTRVV